MLEGTIQYLLIYSPQLESLSPVLTKRNANDGCVKCFGNVKQILTRCSLSSFRKMHNIFSYICFTNSVENFTAKRGFSVNTISCFHNRER